MSAPLVGVTSSAPYRVSKHPQHRGPRDRRQPLPASPVADRSLQQIHLSQPHTQQGYSRWQQRDSQHSGHSSYRRMPSPPPAYRKQQQIQQPQQPPPQQPVCRDKAFKLLAAGNTVALEGMILESSRMVAASRNSVVAGAGPAGSATGLRGGNMGPGMLEAGGVVASGGMVAFGAMQPASSAAAGSVIGRPGNSSAEMLPGCMMQLGPQGAGGFPSGRGSPVGSGMLLGGSLAGGGGGVQHGGVVAYGGLVAGRQVAFVPRPAGSTVGTMGAAEDVGVGGGARRRQRWDC